MKRVLNFLRLIDDDGHLSLTNLAVIVILVKTAIAPTLSVTDIGALLIAVLNYAHRRVVNTNSSLSEGQLETDAAAEVAAQVDKLKAFAGQIDSLKSQISRLNLAFGVTTNERLASRDQEKS